MAIIVDVSRETYEARNETGREIVEKTSANGETYYQETKFRGAVLTTREENWHDDSDFYALVWDDEARKISKVYYATTRAWTYRNGAVADATDEVVEKASDYIEALARKSIDRSRELDAEQGSPRDDRRRLLVRTLAVCALRLRAEAGRLQDRRRREVLLLRDLRRGRRR